MKKINPNLIHFLLPACYAALFLLKLRTPERFLPFLIGVYLGFCVLILDRFLHVFFVEPENEFSQLVRGAWQQRQYRRVFHAIVNSGDLQQQLIARSMFFMIAFAATAIFVLTSTGSIFGAGLVLGIGLHYCLDFGLYLQKLDLLHQHFLWQLKRKFAQQEAVSLFGAITVFFVILTLLGIVGT